MHWIKITIGALVECGEIHIQTGPFGTQLKASDYTYDGIPVINVRNIGYGAIKQGTIEFISENKANALANHILFSDDIVFGRKGAVDRHLLVSEGQSGWIQGSDCIRIRFSSKKLLPRFASYAFCLDRHKKWMLTQCSNKATMASLNQEVINRIPISMPNLDDQHHIVETLSAYDDLIENNRRRIQLLEESARLLYKEWFVHLRFPGHEHVAVVDGVPEGWERKKVGEISHIVMGQSPKSLYYNNNGNGLPFHQGVSNFGVRFPSNKTYCSVPSRLAESGDILFSVRAPVGRINITNDRIIIGRGLAAIRSNHNQQNLLFYTLKNYFFKEDMIGGGAIFAAITKKDLHNVELLSVPEKIAKIFMENVQPIDWQISIIHKAINHLAKARDILLPRLMNGEIII